MGVVGEMKEGCGGSRRGCIRKVGGCGKKENRGEMPGWKAGRRERGL